MINKIMIEENIFPRWEHNIPTLGPKHSHAGNKTGLRFAVTLVLIWIYSSIQILIGCPHVAGDISLGALV